jgi:CHAT domain-containing protein/tetratricopeptide (TPR) repeat protein
VTRTVNVGLLSGFVSCRTWTELQDFVASRASEFNAKIDRRLGLIATYACQHGDDQAAGRLEHYRAVLLSDTTRMQSPTESIDPVGLAAYKDVALAYDVLDVSSWEVALQLASVSSGVSQDDLDAALHSIEMTARQAGEDDEARSAQRHRKVLNRAWESSPAAAIEDAAAKPELREAKDRRTWLEVVYRLAVASEDEIRPILEEYPELLSADADRMLRNLCDRTLVDASGEQECYNMALFLEERRMTLERARRLGLASVGSGQPSAGLGMQEGGVAGITRRASSGDRRALDQVIHVVLRGLRIAIGGEGCDGEQLSLAGFVLAERWRLGGNLVDLRLAVAVYEMAMRSGAGDEPPAVRATRITNLCYALNLLIDASGDRSLIPTLVELSEHLVQLTVRPPEARARALVLLAESLLMTDEDDAALDRVERVIKLCGEALELSVDLPQARLAKAQLALALVYRYKCTGRDDGLDTSLGEALVAVRAAESNGEDVVRCASSLGTSLLQGLITAGRTALAGTAVEFLDIAMRSSASPSTPPVDLLANLTTALLMRYEVAGDGQDLDRALESSRLAARTVDRRWPGAAAVLQGLGNALRRQYDRSAEPADLDEAVAAFDEAAALAQGQDSLIVKSNLAFALQSRYQRFGNLSDLHRSIALLEQLVAETAVRDPGRVARVNALGSAFRLRARCLAVDPGATQADRDAARADLDQAIELLEDVVRAYGDERRGLLEAKSNLGLALRDRFLRDGDARDIEWAARLLRSVVEAAPSASPQLAEMLWNYLLVTHSRIVLDRVSAGRDADDQVRRFMPEHARLLRRAREGGDLGAALDELEAGWRLPVRQDHDSPEEIEGAKSEPLSGLPESLLLHRSGKRQVVDIPEGLWPLYSKLNELGQLQVDLDVVRSYASIWRNLLAHPAFSLVDAADRQQLLFDGATALYLAYNAERSLANLDPLIETFQRLVELLSDGHLWSPAVLIDLARFRAVRHSYAADVNDLDTAFDLLAGLAGRIQIGGPRWMTCLELLGDLLRFYPESGKTTESFAQRVRTVDRLLCALPPEEEGVRWNPVRLAVIAAYKPVSEEPRSAVETLSRVAELAEQVHAVAAQSGEADSAGSMLRFAEVTRQHIADLEAESFEQIAVRPYLENPGDQSDPAAAAERIHRLRVMCRQVLVEENPQLFFMAHGALIIELRRSASGDRADNLDEAMALAHEMQTVAERCGDIESRKLANIALGELYLERRRGELAENIDNALLHYRRVVDATEPNSSEWAQALTGVAYVLAHRIRGDRRTDMEEALGLCRKAVAVADLTEDRDAWARAQFMLGTVFSRRVVGIRADNLERAIESLKAALGVFTRNADSHSWANAHHNLAIALANRVNGDREENLQEAIAHYEQELQFFTSQEWPHDWALAQHGLGNAYSQCRRPNPQQTMRAAVDAFESALTVLTRDAYPGDWARTTNSLGIVLIDGDHIGGRAQNPQRALECFRAVLEASDSDMPPECRGLANGNIVFLLIQYSNHQDNHSERVRYLDEAMKYALQAAGAFSREDRPLNWAWAQASFAQCGLEYASLGIDRYLESSANALESALEVFRANSLITETARAATGLVDIYVRRGEWVRAAAAYRTGVDAAESLYQASVLRDSRDSALQWSRPLIETGVTALVRINDLDGAVVAVERARARWLGEALARNRVDLSRLALEYPDLAADYRHALTLLESAESSERQFSTVAADAGSGLNSAQLAEQIDSARLAVAESISRIRRRVGYDRFLELPDIDDIAAAVRDSEPLLYLVPTDDGCLLLMAHRPPGSEVVVEAHYAESLTKDRLDGLLLGDGAVGESYMEMLATGARSSASLTDVLEEIGRQIVAHIAGLLRKVDASGVILIPGGRLALLPLHAAEYARDGKPTCLLDEFDVRYAPSAWAYASARAAAERQMGPPVLTGIADPIGDLRYARAELETVAKLFGDTRPRLLYGEQATKPALLADLPNATYVHLACHGRYEIADPLESHLLLASGETLSLRELLDGQAFRDARLVVASACQTSVTEFIHLPDEAVGLPAGFLRSGAKAVIGTLWSVDDLSTALLMTRFYELHKVGIEKSAEPAMTIARALRLAQRWLSRVTSAELVGYFTGQDSLRSMPTATARLPAEIVAAGAIRFGLQQPGHCPFQHPYYWAPFMLTGA